MAFSHFSQVKMAQAGAAAEAEYRIGEEITLPRRCFTVGASVEFHAPPWYNGYGLLCLFAKE